MFAWQSPQLVPNLECIFTHRAAIHICWRERERTGIYITKEEEGPVCGCESSAHTMVHCNEFFEYPVTTHYILWLGQVVKTSLWALWRHSTQIQGSLRKEGSGDIHWEW